MSDFVNTIDALGDNVVMDSIVDRTITEFKDDTLSYIGNGAFYGCVALESVNLPYVKTMGSNIFCGCTALTSINLPEFESFKTGVNDMPSAQFKNCKSLQNIDLPKVKYLYSNMFEYCTALTSVNLPEANTLPIAGGAVFSRAVFRGCSALIDIKLPKVSQILTETFDTCTALKVIDLPSCASIGCSFTSCTVLDTLILRYTESVVTLSVANAFTGRPIASGTGYIYVPRALIEDYKVANNWSTYAAQFRALEDYTVDGTTTGELDESKI